MDWEDRTLLKLRRKYSKEETVALISKKLTEVEIELGKVKSERDEAIFEKEKLGRKLKDANLKLEACSKVHQKKIVKRYLDHRNKARWYQRFWQNKYFDVLSRMKRMEREMEGNTFFINNGQEHPDGDNITF